ncbi:MAG TPA: M35 family metallo-endopeptidase [Stellaceae bacterium]|nr:M35 family metallo-endopeptidase [Stellaceae bacterium]
MSSKFTTVYAKARGVLTGQRFAEPDWHKFMTETSNANKLLGPNGFDSAYADALDSIRTRIKKESKHTNVVAVALLGGGPGEVIYNAAQNKKSGGSWFERAAALKMLRHLYRARKTGGQDVWVYAPPKEHLKPVFEEIAGTDGQVKRKLGQESEIFNDGERDLMCDALQLARKVALDCSTKVAGKDNKAKAAVRRWFLDENCTKAELDDAFSKLNAGMKKIAAACSSASLVFTDFIDWRKQRDQYYGAAYKGGEGGGFPVVYLEGAFTRLKGNTGKLWLCAETIIHELSHHELSTDDIFYDSDGLKPDATRFPYAQAINNADSWGYFAIDLAGYLSKADRNGVGVDEGPTIDETPAKTGQPARRVA